MSPEDRSRLLKLIEAGHSPTAAGVSIGLPVADVEKPGPKLAKAIQAALRVGSARLQGKVLELALSANNVQALERELERREAKTRGIDAIARIERVIITAKCPKCGHRPSLAPVPPSIPQRGSNGKAAST